MQIRDFNRLAQETGLPIEWVEDKNNSQSPDPDEIQFPSNVRVDAKYWINNGAFTTNFQRAYAHIEELKRRESVKASLAEGRAVTITTDLCDLSEAEKVMVRHLMAASEMTEALFLKQNGAYDYAGVIQARAGIDPESAQLFERNHGPWAEAPKTAADPYANAHPLRPKRHFGVYPADVEVTEAFLENLPNAVKGPFTVVEKSASGHYVAVPYHVYYAEDMQAIAHELEAAARALERYSGFDYERNLYDYLLAAAQAFRNGDWDEADRKWSKLMNEKTGNYTLRVAPDETYWEPGNTKAAFQFWFALVDRDADQLIKDIVPHVKKMESTLAQLSGVYKPRDVHLEVPKFIKMTIASGDHRHPRGAIVGQKLPNFNDAIQPGAMVVTNYYQDEESKRVGRVRAELMLNPQSLEWFATDAITATTGTVLHELTHSLGPTGNMIAKNPDGTDRKGSDGKPLTVQAALGGRNESVFEELKAQTGSLFWIGWQLEQGMITPERAKQLYTNAILWCFGHISQGMVDPLDGKPKAYSQLAGVQLRALIDEGALVWENGKFTLVYEKFPQAVKKLMTRVIDIKTLGDKAAAEAMLNDVTTGKGFEIIHAQDIIARLQDFPKPSYSFKVVLD